MVNPTTSPLIFSKLLYNIYLPLPIFLPPTNKNYLVIFLNPSPPELPFLRSLPYISLRKHRGSAHRARGLEYKQKQQSPIPPLSGGEAARETRRREKGEECLSGASSADPDGDRSDKPKGPITAAAFLGSFFSLLRRTNKESELV